MKKLLLAALCMLAVSLLAAEKPFPSCEELKKRIRQDHPRLFLTQETIPQFRKHVNSPAMKKELDTCREIADSAPETPRIAPNKLAKIENGKLIILRKTGDQDKIEAYVDGKSLFGRTACRCAVLYMATGEKKYFEKARKYLLAYPELLKFSHGNRLMLEWWNADRLGAIIAWDWLYNDLSPQDRKAFMEPLLDYTKIINNKPGYMTYGGYGTDSGNYGEKGLLLPLGFAVWGEPYRQDFIEWVLKDGYKNETSSMEWREAASAGTGQLAYPAANYSLGAIPYSSFTFLHILRSATGLDGTEYFPQMRDFARYYSWITIPGVMANGEPGLISHGWGNAFHTENGVPIYLAYTHMAQLIHFFGTASPERAAEARAVIARLPESYRKHSRTIQWNYPHLAFSLSGFDPSAPVSATSPEKQTGMFYPTSGLLFVRSGTGPEDTYASCSLGRKLVSAGHYDELAFVIYKQGMLTSATGCRGSAPHHLAYWPQTVSKNTILIRMEEEPLPRHWYPQNGPKVDWSKIYCDGGQTVKGAGKHLGVQQTERYVIGAGDGTATYSPLKCREAVRQFVYIKPDYFVIYDRVESVKPDQEKVFLLHTQTRPECLDQVWTATEYKGRLFWKTLLPEKAKQTVIGGPGKEFWSNGRNYPLDPIYQDLLYSSRNFLGKYRMEITPRDAGETVRFLHVLQASPIAETRMVPAKLLRDKTHDGAELLLPSGEKVQVRFNRNGKVAAEVRFVK